MSKQAKNILRKKGERGIKLVGRRRKKMNLISYVFEYVTIVYV